MVYCLSEKINPFTGNLRRRFKHGLNLRGTALISLFSLVSALLQVRPALAQSLNYILLESSPSKDADFDILTARAAEKYSQKDFNAAIELFEQAYKIKSEVNILFNLGRIHEEAGNYENAIGYYEKFIADTNADYEARQRALRRLSLLREMVKINNQNKSKDPALEVKPEDAKLLNNTQEQPQSKIDPKPVKPPVQAQKPPSENPNQIRKIHVVGFSTLGVGAALLIGGGIAAGIASRRHDTFKNTSDDLNKKREVSAKGKNAAVAADALFISGGILAATSVILLVIPEVRKYKQSRAKAQITPAISPTIVGLGIQGAF